MLSVNVLLQPHVFNSSCYFLSLVRAKKKGKNLYQFFIQKLRVRVVYECVLYSNKYGISSINLDCMTETQIDQDVNTLTVIA